MASQVAERYGQALFELAKESGELVRWGQQARGLAAVVEENPQLLDFFNAVKISAEEKKQMVNTLFAGQVDNMLVHFLDLLIDKKRTKHTVEILRQFISLENAERGVAEGVVYSARKLAKEGRGAHRTSDGEAAGTESGTDQSRRSAVDFRH